MLEKVLYTILFLILSGMDFAANLPASAFAKTTLSIENRRDASIREDISRIADIISEFVRLRTEFRRFDIGSRGNEIEKNLIILNIYILILKIIITLNPLLNRL